MGMRSVHDSHIGDTFHHPNFTITPLPGFKSAKPMVKAWLQVHWHVELYTQSVLTTFLGTFPMFQYYYWFLKHATLKSQERLSIVIWKLLNLYFFPLQVFAGLYPMETGEYPAMRLAVEKLTLNDSSVTVHRDSSVALGQGWRLGFLGLLHMDIFRQRLEEVL